MARTDETSQRETKRLVHCIGFRFCPLDVTLTAQSDQTRRYCDAAPAGQESNRRNCGGLERHLVACGFLFLRLAVSATGSASASSPTLTFHSRKVFEQRTRIHQNLRFCSSSDTFVHFAKAKTDLLVLTKLHFMLTANIVAKYLLRER